MESKRLGFAIGESDFATLRRKGTEYVDKSLFIRDVLEDPSPVLLFPRPRRFGKTLNLSMLRYFFEKSTEERWELFRGLQVGGCSEVVPHFQQYPVIFLTFKDVKEGTWAEALTSIRMLLSRLYGEHRYLLEGSVLAAEEKRLYQEVLDRRSEDSGKGALLLLSEFLHRYHKKKVWILLDEYDTPLHAAHERYYDEAAGFFRGLLSGALKDNPHLEKGVLTGILRVAKESLFSGLNNIKVYSLLRNEFSSAFGFTEEEVQALVNRTRHPELMEEIRAWYNGYQFGKTRIYNPWSILNFLADPEHTFQPYWTQTSSNELIRTLLFEGKQSTHRELEVLLEGGRIDKPLQENVSLREIKEEPEILWAFLAFSGYLRVEKTYYKDDALRGELQLVNREVRGEFRGLFRTWFAKQLGSVAEVEDLVRGLLSGNVEQVEVALNTLVRTRMSYHDVARLPEAVYHAFVLGVLTHLGGTYEVQSNAESGYGRADTVIVAKEVGKPGVVLEYKAVSEEGVMEAEVQRALKQMATKQYRTQLEARGAKPVYEYALVFCGKKVKVAVQKV